MKKNYVGISIFILFLLIFSGSCSTTATSSSKQVTLKIDGLTDIVKIYQDKYGIYHIYAKNDDDLIFAQGYIEAKSRLFYMDMLRNVGKGNLGSMIGNIIPEIREVDRFMRELLYGLDGKSSLEKTLEKTPAPVKKELEQFAKGVNSFINQVRAGYESLPKMYSYYALGKDFLTDWSPEDTLAIGRLAQFALCGLRNPIWKINRALWEDVLPEDIKKDWIVTKVPTTTSIIFGKQSFSSKSSFSYSAIPFSSQELDTFKSNIQQIFDVLTLTKNVGSNNWVISGSISKSGNTILANDPHLPLLSPPIWQGFHLDSKKYGNGKIKMTGYVLSGIPALMIGFNEHLGWGVTMAGYDVSDVFLQKVYEKNGKYYAEKPGDDVEIKVAYTKYKVRVDDNTWENRVLPVYYIPNDSVLIMWKGKVDNPLYTPPTTGAVISFRWPGMDASREMETYYHLITASSVEDFNYAMSFFEVGAQNFVMANTNGDIAYNSHSMVPLRSSGARPWRLMNGYEDEGKWLGYLSDKIMEKAILVNPDRGYISTANNDIFGILEKEEPVSTFDPYFYTSKWPGFRAERIDNLLNEGKNEDKLDVEYIEKMHGDSLTLFGKFFAPFLVTAATARPDLVTQWKLEKAVNYIKNWSYHTYSGLSHGNTQYTKEQIPDSIATSLFEEWMRKLKEEIYSDECEYYKVPMPEVGLPCTAIKSMYHILNDSKQDVYSYSVTVGGSVLFDDILTPQVETKNYIILKSFKDAVEHMLKLQKTDNIDELRWGKVHKFLLIAPAYLDSRGPYPVDGDEFTVNPASPIGEGTYISSNGASVRLIVEFDKNGVVSAEGSLPGAADEDWHNGSDQFNRWWEVKYYPLLNDEDEIKKGMLKEIILDKK